MLQPARQKFRKMQKGRNKGIATTGNKVSFGEFGLKAVGRGRLTALDGGCVALVESNSVQTDYYPIL